MYRDAFDIFWYEDIDYYYADLRCTLRYAIIGMLTPPYFASPLRDARSFATIQMCLFLGAACTLHAGLGLLPCFFAF